MKRPVMEVIRFDEADIVTASGLGGMGFTADYFGDGTQGNGTFSFFGGSGSGPVTTGAGHDVVLDAFKSNFSQNWSSTGDIWVEGSYGGESWTNDLYGIINSDRVYDDTPNDLRNLKKYNGTYYYDRENRSFYSN